MRKRIEQFSEALSEHSQKLNLTGAHAGVFFLGLNLTFASYVYATGKSNFLDDSNVQQVIDYAGYAFTAASVLTPFAVAHFGLTLYPRIIFTLSNVGLLTAFLNVRRFSSEFVDQVSATPDTRLAYLIGCVTANIVPPALALVQSRLPDKSDAITAFSTLSAKSGPFVGAAFGVFLLQLTSFSQNKIAPVEANMLSNFIVIALVVEFALAYAVQKNYEGDISKANKWIQYPIFMFNLLRELISSAGNLLIPSNILSVTSNYPHIPTAVLNNVNTATGIVGSIIGVNNFYQAIQRRLSFQEASTREDYLLDAPSSTSPNSSIDQQIP